MASGLGCWFDNGFFAGSGWQVLHIWFREGGIKSGGYVTLP